MDGSRRVIAIGGAFFDPWSIFDPVMIDRMSNFREIEILKNQILVLKAINRSEFNFLLACFQFNSEQNDVLFRYFDRQFVT